MRKIMTVLLLAALVTGSVFAEDGLAISGEVKTGLNISKDGDDDVVARVKNSDDAGTPGRIRFNFVYTKGNIQFKWRFQLREAGDKFDEQNTSDFVAYAYALGDFFDDQFRISLGKIGGDSPWETSGDEIWANVDNIQGARFEFKPAFLSSLNVGMALGAKNNAYKLEDYLQEFIFGARYENDAIDTRLGFALDGPGDGTDGEPDGSTLVWRLNAKFVGSAVPDLSVWLNGQVKGIGGTVKDTNYNNKEESRLATDEWLYIKYAPNPWDAALRLGLHTFDGTSAKQTTLNVKPVFNYKFNDWLSANLYVNAELLLGYKEGIKIDDEDPVLFDTIEVGPKLTFDLGSGASIATAYTLTQKMPNSISAALAGDTKGKATNQFEIRFVYSF
ncbi:MAG: hypothetical protein LBJ41_05515 [Treponema sp.]|jgi:hypothetical protein|nr:hypothetical protein [Treponema sp.]